MMICSLIRKVQKSAPGINAILSRHPVRGNITTLKLDRMNSISTLLLSNKAMAVSTFDKLDELVKKVDNNELQ